MHHDNVERIKPVLEVVQNATAQAQLCASSDLVIRERIESDAIHLLVEQLVVFYVWELTGAVIFVVKDTPAVVFVS